MSKPIYNYRAARLLISNIALIRLVITSEFDGHGREVTSKYTMLEIIFIL